MGLNEELLKRGSAREDLTDLVEGYDRYIWNNGEPWDADRQPVCFLEWLDNEQSLDKEGTEE